MSKTRVEVTRERGVMRRDVFDPAYKISNALRGRIMWEKAAESERVIFDALNRQIAEQARDGRGREEEGED
jgi:hypothetical protein